LATKDVVIEEIKPFTKDKREEKREENLKKAKVKNLREKIDTKRPFIRVNKS